MKHFFSFTHIVCAFTISMVACKKEAKPTPPIPVDTIPVFQTPVDPSIAPTIGFFLNDWQPKTFTVPSFTDAPVPPAGGVIIDVNVASVITKVPLSIFGNNANPYMTQMVTEPTLLDHIKNLHPHIIRFPGGNLSSVFFWNADKGVKPADAPDTLVDANGVKSGAGYWYGKNAESWTLSTDNYYSMLQQTGNQGIITINYAYARYSTAANPVAAAAHLAADWVRYDNGRTKYWEIGNESNGTWQAGFKIDVTKNKDGQPETITGDIYGQHYKVFADSMRKAAQEIGKTIYIGAQLLEGEAPSWANTTDKTWNAGIFSKAQNSPDYYIIHSYFTPYQQNSNATVILNTGIDNTKRMMDYVKSIGTTSGVTQKPIALTEWNIFAEGSMQMVSHVSGLHADLVLGELLNSKYGMASRWDLANSWSNGNDHGMFNTGDEPGAVKWNPRPSFYHMYYFQKMLGDRFIGSTVTGSSDIAAYASSFTSGQTGVIVVNKGTSAVGATVTFKNFAAGNRYYWYTLTGGTDNGEFSRQVLVNGKGPSGVSGGPLDYATLKPYSATTATGVRIAVPPRSSVYVVIDKK